MTTGETSSAMKTVNVLYFASIREALGTGSESLQTQATTVGELRAQIIRDKGEVAAQALAENRAVRMALNQLMCKTGAPLENGDEVAFFPPVTGG